MKDIDSFLFNLRKEKNVSVTVKDGQLRVIGAKDTLDSKLIEDIKSRKEDILGYFESQEAYHQVQIPKSPTKERYRLSSAQKRVFFEKSLDRESVAYNLPSAIRLRGGVDIAKFEATFKKIIERHEILRTSFEVIEGELYQTIHPAVDFSIERSKSPATIPSIVKNFIRPFNLNQAPLIRAGLFEFAEEDHLFILDLHHIITDGISNSILIKEFVELYNLQDLPLPNLQYKDYAEWQYSEVYSKIVAEQKAFWEKEFFEMPTAIELPLDYPRSSSKKKAADAVDLLIDSSKTQKLKLLGERLEATPYSILLSVYYILLSKLSSQQDITIGTVTTGRITEDLEDLPGMFVNTIPLRNFPRRRMSYKEFLTEVKYKVASCFDNQIYQFESLVQDLNIPRGGSSRNPIFDVFFAYQNYTQSQLEIPGLSIEPVEEGLIKTVFDIELTAVETEGGIQLTFLYNADLFKRESIQRFSSYFDKILTQITKDFNIQLSEIQLISAEEQADLVNKFNETKAAYPKEKTIIDIFEEQARQVPKNVAVWVGNDPMTYEELKESSDKIANYLRIQRKVEAGDLVGLLMDREEEMFPTIFGIMKAGAVYVPLSLNFPKERLKSIISEANLKLLITRGSVSGELVGEIEIDVLDLDRAVEKIHSLPPDQKGGLPKGNDLAYIIFTSGSTGKPKGVMIEHHSIVNRLLWMQKKYPLTDADVLIQKTPLIFDVSIWELFWWVFSGASVYVLPPKDEKEPKKIVQAIAQYKVTTIHFVPTMLNAFLEVVQKEEDGELKTLKKVFSSGEALTLDQVQSFGRTLNRKYRTQLINLYGPTEATVDVSYYDCDFSEKNNSIPIGKPIDNTCLYVMNKEMYVSPVGVPGELHIGGAGLARGYLNNERLTEEKFIASPFKPGERLYKTGDLARWLPDGNIEFLGRIDNQVKIRGYRIELGEIENHIKSFDGIKEVAVLAKEIMGSDKALIAYCTSEAVLEREDLRNYLLEILPEYMVPHYYIFLDDMPLNNSGKLDRKALLRMNPQVQFEYVAPRNDFEEGLTSVWADVLSLPKVGITDDFFVLGGDSIKAIKLVYQIEEKLGYNLELVDLYNLKTIENLSSVMMKEKGEDKDKAFEMAVAEIEEFQKLYRDHSDFPEIYEEVYPMSGIEKGMIYYTLLKDNDEKQFDNIIYHEQNFYPINYSNFQLDLFEKAVDLMLRKHNELRKVYDLDYFAHIILRDIEPEINFFDISDYSEEEQKSFWIEKINSERLRASGKSKELLWRMNLLKLRENFHYLILDTHHSLFDGWSLHAFLTELNNTYVKLMENINHRPEPLASSYKDHIIREIMDVNNPKYIQFWKSELKDYERFQFVKTGEEHRFITKFFPLDSEINHQIKSLASKLNISIKDIFFSAYTYVISMLSYKNDFVVGLTTNNRPLIKDGEKILGCFLNHVPFRVRIPSEGTWKDFLTYISEKNKKLKAYERVPFYKIREIIDEPLQMGVNPVFDLAFTFIDFWITEDIVLPTTVEQDLPDFWHDNNDVNQNTLFDFFVKKTDGKFNVYMEYSTAILNEDKVNRIFWYFKNVLNQFIYHTNNPFNNAFVLEEKELDQVLVEFNNTEIAYPQGKTLMGFFEEQVQKTPAHIAIMDEYESVSYEELNSRINQLAHYLKGQGLERGRAVGVLMDRSIDFVVSVFAILKSGAPYLPIDPGYPVDRIQYMLKDSNAQTLLTKKAYLVNNPIIENCKVIEYDSIAEDLLQLEASNPRRLYEENLYILYTSGSTGVPKGVVGLQQGLLNRLHWFWRNFPHLEDEVFCFKTHIGFVDHVGELFSPLLTGIPLRIISNEVVLDISRMFNLLVKDKITRITLVPSYLKALVGFKSSGKLEESSLRYVFSSGEYLPFPLSQEFYKSFTHARLINLYGSTEVSADATYWNVEKKEVQEEVGDAVIPIGNPIANMKVFIVNKSHQLQPIGVPGELCISGKGLSKGYVNQEVLTAEKFIKNPFKTGERLYKTGDLARRRDDGTIEYLGRLDNQVKIRGFRIELDEIEAKLLTHKDIRDARVLTKERGEDTFLVAYYTSKEEIANSVLHDFLTDYLPDYMIPSYYSHLVQFPLTSSGKIDRKALPEPGVTLEDDYIAPTGETEKTLVELWSEVLYLEPEVIGINHSFFKLGGHSLNLIMLSNKIFQSFDIRISVKEIFNYPTIEEQAEIIEALSLPSYQDFDGLDLTEVAF